MRTIAAVAITLSLEGRAITAGPGQTVAATLIAAGMRVCRVTESGERRGVFCGMGVCQECVMTIDGEPLRACMTLARDGMTVAPFRAGERLVAPAGSLEPVTLEPEVLVLGGGPAGLSAAAAAAEAGAAVVLVDERAKLGGQFYKQPAAVADVSALDRQYRDGRELIARAEAAGVEVLSGVQVWAATGASEVLAFDDAHAYALRPQRLVLATGAYERGVPMPGWTLPGFMTTGAAQTLLRAYGVLPGRRVLLSGNGPLNIQVAAELARAGAEVVAVCELSTLRRPAAAAAMALAAPSLMLQGLRMSAMVPLLRGHSVIRAEGDGAVELATVAPIGRVGKERTFEVDAVCVGYGFLPSNEVARTLGLEHRFDEELGQLAAVVDERGRSSLEGVWVVGDGAGTGGAPHARAIGFLAGLDAARSLGREVAESQEERSARRRRARSHRFQEGLNRLFAAPRLVDQLATPETLVCRCEEVTLSAVEASFGDGAAAIGAVKRLTRAGMGRCQGRYCASVLAGLASRRTGAALTEEDWFAPAAPFKPIPVALAATAAAQAQTE
jgi:NADPH-dependent 2,4-dienoyl-CoA reductase/sulfur reductase-like enzyme